jgi:MFS family permease
VVATVLASVDRQILILVTEPLKRSLHVSDTQIGALNGIGLTLVAALATFPLGWLVDRVDRRALLAFCIVFWSLSTAACGLTQTFPQIFACSMGIALGEAVLGPVSYAVIPDLFPKERWIQANYVFFVTGVVGTAAGLTFSGGVIGLAESHRAMLPPTFATMDPWRLALFAVGAPGVLLAVLVLLIRLPRQVAHVSTSSSGSLRRYMREHLRTLIGVFLGFSLVACAYGTLGTWIAVVLVRDFGETPAHTGVRLGSVMALGSILGVVSSAGLVRWLRPRVGQLIALRVAQIGSAGACLAIPLYALAHETWYFYGIVCLQVIASTCALSLSPTVLQLMAPRLMRGRVVALGGLLSMLFVSLSPLAVGVVSDALGHRPMGLVWAIMAVAAPCYVLGFVFLHFAESSLPRTFAAVAAEPDSV